MPYYRRSFGSYGGYRRGRYGSRYASRYFRRYWRRPSVYRSQLNSTRTFTVCIPVENVYEMSIAANAHYSNLLRTNPFQAPIGAAATTVNLRVNAQSLCMSELFKTYVGLYDQMKVNWIRHKIGVGLQLGGAGTSAVKIYTAWDRRMTIAENVPSFDDMANGPESQCQMFVENSRPQITRFCTARDLIEKVQFYDAKLTSVDDQYECVKAWRSASSNVNFFAPAMFMGIQTADTTDATRTIPISVSTVYSVTFRQPRFGLSSASRGATFGEMKSEALKGAADDTEIVAQEPVESGMGDESEVRTDMTDEEIEALIKKLKEKG